MTGTGHYVLALKANQATLYADVQARSLLMPAAKQPEYGMTSASDTTSGHGRIETRTTGVINDLEVIAYLDPGNHWRDLASVALVEAQRHR
ncbi:MAG: hypothetical protein U0074_05185 [Kouleothrix sp.]